MIEAMKPARLKPDDPRAVIMPASSEPAMPSPSVHSQPMLTAPSLVIHGADDPLVPVEGGRDTAAAIAGATILEIPGMGHDLPLALVDTIADAIADHATMA